MISRKTISLLCWIAVFLLVNFNDNKAAVYVLGDDLDQAIGQNGFDTSLNDTILMTHTHQTYIISTYIPGVNDENDTLPGTSHEHIIPPIMVINLDRATSRWEKVSTTLRAAGLTDQKFTRLSAVDGRTLSLEELRDQSTKLAMFLQPRGVIGCYLSHRKFWKYVVDQHLDRAIVLEDDIQLVDGFKEKLIESLRQIDSEDAFDVLFLGAIGTEHHLHIASPPDTSGCVCIWCLPSFVRNIGS